jgi:hypothetical protein
VAPVFAVIDTFRQGAEAVGKYQEVGDWGGGALAVLRAICDGGASIADNVSNVPPGSSRARVPSSRSSSASAPSPPRSPGSVSRSARSPRRWRRSPAVAKTVKVVARLISAALNGIKVVLDYVLLLHNASKAEEAEAAGDFERAAKYRQLMQGNAVDLVTDTISTITRHHRPASSA